MTRSPAPAPVPAGAPRASSDAAPEPTHGCVRCGTPIPVSESMCEACNPLGLKAPAASQAHATVFLGIGLAVVIMAVVARLLIADIGPFRATIDGIERDAAGLRATVTITNEGTNAGSVTCRIDDPNAGGISPNAVFTESPRVPGNGTVTFGVVVAGLGTEPRPLLVACGR